MDTTRARIPSAASWAWAFTARSTSEPVAISIYLSSTTLGFAQHIAALGDIGDLRVQSRLIKARF